MQPHLHMLASFALVDIARLSNEGEQILKQADWNEIPGELADKLKGDIRFMKNLGQAGKDSIGDWAGGVSDLAQHGTRNFLGLESNDINYNSNPLATLGENMGSIGGAQDLLGKMAPHAGAIGGGLLGTAIGAGGAKLLQGKPENEEDEKANRTDMLLAALAGGGLGALGGGAAGLQPLVKEKMDSIGRNPAVRQGLETGASAYGNVVSKLKELLSKAKGAVSPAATPAG